MRFRRGRKLRPLFPRNKIHNALQRAQRAHTRTDGEMVVKYYGLELNLTFFALFLSHCVFDAVRPHAVSSSKYCSRSTTQMHFSR